MSLNTEPNQEDADMENILNITASFEPITEEVLKDISYRSFNIAGYQGSIIIQSEYAEFNNHLVFHIRRQVSPIDVLRKEIKILEQMQEDIGNMIDQLKQRVNS